MTDMASACLVGTDCRYDGASKPNPELVKKFNAGEIIPFCPETVVGLGVPRSRMKLSASGEAVLDGNGIVRNEKGEDKTSSMIEGAKKISAFAALVKPGAIFLKSKSPSCGIKTDGIKGVTTALLERKGFILEEFD